MSRISAAGGVEFSDNLQEGLIENHGVDMIHSIATRCTCQIEDVYAGMKRDGVDRRREPFCSRCRGDGWLYRAPKIVRGLATSIRQQKNILDAGIAQPGDMIFSPLQGPQMGTCDDGAEARVSAWDKLTATWSQTVDDGQVIRRGAGTEGENLALETGLSLDEDRLWYEPDRAIWCEDEDDVVYHFNADFTLGPGKIIKWIGNKPPVGRRYTIKYTAFFDWIVFQNPQERRDKDAKDLGLLVFLRKKHAVILNDSPRATADDRISLVSRTSC